MSTIALQQAMNMMSVGEVAKVTRYANWLIGQRTASDEQTVPSRAAALNRLKKHRGILGDADTEKLREDAVREKYGDFS